jgi:predicted nucleotidyltransferase
MDGNRKKVKKKIEMKKFGEIIESIIDIPRRTYAPMVFNDADTMNPKIKPEVKALIDAHLKEFEKEYPVLKTSLIGSILTKRYRNDADLDINVLFDVPVGKREDERVRLSKKYLSASNPDNIQGQLIPGSEHPINFYFITDEATYEDQNKKADAVFDIERNVFIKRPEDFNFDVNLYIQDFSRKVQELDVVKGELKRDIIDYDELTELSPNDILNLQDKINEKLEEIEDSIRTIIRIGDNVDAERRAVFDKDMSPDEIRDYGVKNRLPKNVIYKMLEKYHYLKFYKKCKKILDDGEVTDAEIDSIRNESVAKIQQTKGLPNGSDCVTIEKMDNNTMIEATKKSIAFAFGRFNPPTIGHEKLINKVKSVPTTDYKIYLSRSEDPKKNPLSPRDKLSIMKKLFPSHARNIEINQTNMVLDIATELYKKGYTDVTMVAGSDRVREFENILQKYNGVKSRHGLYDFDSIKVVSAGERDPDAEGATGMSASKMRDAAAKGDLKSFEKGLPKGVDAAGIMKQVRRGMKLAASFGGMSAVGTGARPIVSLEEFEQQQIRDLYIREMIFNIGDEVDYVKEDIQGKVVRRSTNYIVVEDNKNNLHKAWIWDCVPIAADREVEVREYNLDVDYGFEAVSEKKSEYGHTDSLPQDRDVKKQKGTQPKKYFKSLSKDVKDKRASHFRNTDTTKNDNDPAPGDDKSKTKPSKFTSKYKKMYGELRKDLNDACWTGYKQVGMKNKGGKQVPNCVPESYEIGADYANHTKEITPGQTPDAKPVDAKDRGKPTEKDVKEWAASDTTIDKYKQRYKTEWKARLDEVVSKMMEKI